MRFASPYAVACGLLIAGVYIVRAATGVPAAHAYELGRATEHSGTYESAAKQFERGAVGANRIAALWRSGWGHVEAWREQYPWDRYGVAGDQLLRKARSLYLDARAASPGSAWVTAGLGDVYMRRERTVRANRTVSMAALEGGPWSLVGDDGRIAIGLTRAAIEREPTRFNHRDQLVLVLKDLGLHEEALRAMAESARVLPDFGAHPDLSFEDLPKDLVETFWQTARAVAPGEAPVLSREQQLLSAGQLGRRLGHLAEAEQDLRGALEAPGTALGRAEDAFHLGLVLFDLGRFDEAEAMFARADREAVFKPGVANMRALMAERQGRLAEALEQLREARRLQPREESVLLEFARVAQKNGEWDQAEEALRWAIMVHPEGPGPRLALVDMLAAKRDPAGARKALDDYRQVFGRTDDAVRREQSLAATLDPARR